MRALNMSWHMEDGQLVCRWVGSAGESNSDSPLDAAVEKPELAIGLAA